MSVTAALALCAASPLVLLAEDAHSSGTATTPPVKPYLLKYCLVSGEKFGGMGKPFVTNYMGQEIKFCCPDCVKDFNKSPKKYLKKLAAAQKKESAGNQAQ